MGREQRIRNLSMLDKGLAGLVSGYNKSKDEAKAQAKWQAYQDLQREIQANKDKVDGQQLIDYALSMGLPYDQITQWITPDKKYNWRLGKEWIDELNSKAAIEAKKDVAETGANAKKEVAKIQAKAKVNKPSSGRPETASGPDIQRKVMERLISNKGYDPRTPLMTIAGANEGQLDDILKAYPTAMQAAIEAEGLTGRIRPAAPFKIVEPGGFWSSPEIQVLPGYEMVPQADGTVKAQPTPTPVPGGMPVQAPAVPAQAQVVRPTIMPAPGPEMNRQDLRKQFRR